MALKTYQKSPLKFKKPQKKETFVFKVKEEKEPLTLWDVMVGIKHDFTVLMESSTLARVIVPGILIISGGFILYNQIAPKIIYTGRNYFNYYGGTNIALVKGESIQPKYQYLSNPGSEYFKELTEKAMNKHVLNIDPEAKKYKGQMTISIPSLSLNSLPVQANVESGDEAVYDKILQTSLAHFEGTGLPGTEIKNNIVVYGHSSGGDYYSRTRDIAAAFTKLPDVKIGDEIELVKDGKRYKYRVQKTKIVNPDDISIINGQADKETLTLFTCYPPGDGDQRIVVVARPI